MAKYQISCFALDTSMHPPEKIILDSNFNMTLNSSLTASYSEHSFVSKGPTGHMAVLKDSGL